MNFVTEWVSTGIHPAHPRRPGGGGGGGSVRLGKRARRKFLTEDVTCCD